MIHCKKSDVEFHLRRARFQVLISMSIFGQDRNKVTCTYVQNIYNVVKVKFLHERRCCYEDDVEEIIK